MTINSNNFKNLNPADLGFEKQKFSPRRCLPNEIWITEIVRKYLEPADANAYVEACFEPNETNIELIHKEKEIKLELCKESLRGVYALTPEKYIEYKEDYKEIAETDVSHEEFLSLLLNLRKLRLSDELIIPDLLNYLQTNPSLTSLEFSISQLLDHNFIRALPGLTHLKLSIPQTLEIDSLIEGFPIFKENYRRIHRKEIKFNDFLKFFTSLDLIYMESSTEIDGTSINDEDFSFLLEQTQIEHLKVSCGSHNQNFAFLKQLINLRSLHIEAIRDPDCLGHIFSQLKSLVDLSLWNCSDLQEITFLEQAPQLEKLCFFGCDQIENFSALSCLVNLTKLILNESVTDLSFLENATKLKKLECTSTKIEDISVLQSLTQLEELYLGGNINISDWLPLQYLSELKHLNLSDTQVSNEDMQYITSERLNYLELSYCPQLTDLSHLQENTELEVLDLSHLPNDVDISESLKPFYKLRALELPKDYEISKLDKIYETHPDIKIYLGSDLHEVNFESEYSYSDY